MDNLSEAETKRRKLIIHIQKLYQKGISIHKIARITGKERKTVKKNLEGYQDFIIKSIQKSLTQSAIARELTSLGYTETISNARQYICTIALHYGMEISKYSNRQARYNDDGTLKPKLDYITRKGIFNYLWMNTELTQAHHDYLWQQLPILSSRDGTMHQRVS